MRPVLGRLVLTGLTTTHDQQQVSLTAAAQALTRENDLMVVVSFSFILPQRFSLAPVVRV
jgi:hypothetical protein